MKEIFTSVKAALDCLEFCPLCDKRNDIDVLLLDSKKTYNTYLDNKELKATYVDTSREAFIIDIHANTVKAANIRSNVIPAVSFSCKRHHFTWGYKVLGRDSITLKAYQYSINITDKKYNKRYYVVSTYDNQNSTVDISIQSSIVDSFDARLIDFKDFDQKSVLSKLRAISLLR